jgi:hypothetical protein
MDGMRMLREEECATDDEIGVLHSGKIFRYSRKRIVVDREEKHNEIEERDTGVILQIEGIPWTEGKYHQLGPVEEYPLHPTQVILCIKPMIPCASPRTEVRYESLSIVVSEGSKDSSKGSQSSGNSTIRQASGSITRRNIVQYTMVGVDPTLRMFVFHGVGSEDP